MLLALEDLKERLPSSSGPAKTPPTCRSAAAQATDDGIAEEGRRRQESLRRFHCPPVVDSRLPKLLIEEETVELGSSADSALLNLVSS